MTERPAAGFLRRRPSDVLVVDTNIALSAALGRRSISIFDTLAGRRLVAASARVAEEVRRVLGGVPDLPAIARVRAEMILGGVDVVDAARYADHIEHAAAFLSNAFAPRNGSTSDVHVVAWLLDADIWSHDRDLPGPAGRPGRTPPCSARSTAPDTPTIPR